MCDWVVLEGLSLLWDRGIRTEDSQRLDKHRLRDPICSGPGFCRISFFHRDNPTTPALPHLRPHHPLRPAPTHCFPRCSPTAAAVPAFSSPLHPPPLWDYAAPTPRSPPPAALPRHATGDPKTALCSTKSLSPTPPNLLRPYDDVWRKGTRRLL